MRVLNHCGRVKLRGSITDRRDQFFRVAFGVRPGTAVIMSAKTVSLIDIEDSHHPETVLLECTGQGRFFTSLDKTTSARRATYTTLCTTHEVLWIDEYKVGPPVLSWKHNYGGGRIRDLNLTLFETAHGGDFSDRSAICIIAHWHD